MLTITKILFSHRQKKVLLVSLNLKWLDPDTNCLALNYQSVHNWYHSTNTKILLLLFYYKSIVY